MMAWTDPVFHMTFRLTCQPESVVWEFVTAAVLILAVLLLRAIVKKRFSARARYALWAVVLVRLLLSVTVGESAFGIRELLEHRDAFQALEMAPADIQELENGDVEIQNNWYAARIPEKYVQESTEESVLFSDRGLGLSIRQLRGLTQLCRGMMVIYLAGAGTVAVFLLAVNLAFRIRLRRRRQPVGNYQGRRCMWRRD